MPPRPPSSFSEEEVTASLNHLRARRDALREQIAKEERERDCLAREVEALQARLGTADESLTARAAVLAEYNAALAETTAAFGKIQESSQTLLHFLRRETRAIGRREGGEGVPAPAAAAAAAAAAAPAPAQVD